jgi:hypothetical protein
MQSSTPSQWQKPAPHVKPSDLLLCIAPEPLETWMVTASEFELLKTASPRYLFIGSPSDVSAVNPGMLISFSYFQA